MRNQRSKQKQYGHRGTCVALVRTGLASLTTAGVIMTSGCLSVPVEQSHQEMERRATATLAGIDRLPRQSPGDNDMGNQVQDLLADDLTAETVVRIALWNNPRIQSHYARLDVAAAERLAARLLKNPQAHGSVIFSEEDSSEEVIELGAEINLLHLILLPKRRRIGTATYEAVKLDVARAVQKLAYDTRVACYRLLAAQQRLAMRESVMQAAEAARDMAQRLRDAGNIKELDQLNREALYEQAALGVSAAALTVEEEREALNMLMGLSGDETSWQLTGELPPPGDNGFRLGEVVDNALQNSIQLEKLRWDIEAAAQALGIARAKSVIPALHVGVDAEREPDGVWMVGPMIAVELPLFNFGQARRPAAKSTLKRLRHEYAAVAIDIAATARRAARRAEVASGRVRRYRETLLPLRKDITHLTHLQYNAMQLGVFQLLQAKQMEIAGDSAYIDELLTYWIARIEIEQIRNGLLVDSRATVNAPADVPMAGGGGGGH